MDNKAPDFERKQASLDQLQESLAEISAMKTRLDKWAVILEQARLDDLLHNYTNPKRIILFNLLAGIARGVGISVGTTIIIGLLGYLLKDFVTLPVIGEYIARLLEWVNHYLITDR